MRRSRDERGQDTVSESLIPRLRPPPARAGRAVAARPAARPARDVGAGARGSRDAHRHAHRCARVWRRRRQRRAPGTHAARALGGPDRPPHLRAPRRDGPPASAAGTARGQGGAGGRRRVGGSRAPRLAHARAGAVAGGAPQPPRRRPRPPLGVAAAPTAAAAAPAGRQRDGAAAPAGLGREGGALPRPAACGSAEPIAVRCARDSSGGQCAASGSLGVRSGGRRRRRCRSGATGGRQLPASSGASPPFPSRTTCSWRPRSCPGSSVD